MGTNLAPPISLINLVWVSESKNWVASLPQLSPTLTLKAFKPFQTFYMVPALLDMEQVRTSGSPNDAAIAQSVKLAQKM